MSAARRSIAIGIAVAAVLCWTAPFALAQGCQEMEDPAVPGQLLGCCQGGVLRTSGTCIDPNQSCREGVCNASGQCVQGSGWSAVDGHPPCHNPVDPCQMGECYNRQCQGINNQAGYVSACPSDDNECTLDCKVNVATSHPLDVLCREGAASPSDFWVPGTPECSIPNGTSACETGHCEAGECEPDGGVINCTGTLGICERWECIAGGQCAKGPKEPGTNCEAPLLLEDCHDKRCVIDNSGKGQCRDRGRALVGEECEDGDGERCTRGQCSAAMQCNNVIGITTGTPCPVPPGQVDANGNTCDLDYCVKTSATQSTCSLHVGDPARSGQPCESDGLNCTLDLCNASGTGACEHSQPDPAQQGQPCTNVPNTCHNATCVGTTCTAQSCKTTGNCFNCSGYPACVNNWPHCGCQ